MDPLITNGVDPALLRVLEKRGESRDAGPRRRRAGAAEKAPEEEQAEEQDAAEEPGVGRRKHEIDDLA